MRRRAFGDARWGRSVELGCDIVDLHVIDGTRRRAADDLRIDVLSITVRK
jgi:hypothetical protein